MPKLDEIEMSSRLRYALSRYDIATTEQLSEYSRKDLMRMKNIGRKSVREAVEILEAYGGTLAGSDRGFEVLKADVVKYVAPLQTMAKNLCDLAVKIQKYQQSLLYEIYALKKTTGLSQNELDLFAKKDKPTHFYRNFKILKSKLLGERTCDIAREYDLSHTRVTQICRMLMRKYRHPRYFGMSFEEFERHYQNNKMNIEEARARAKERIAMFASLKGEENSRGWITEPLQIELMFNTDL